MKGRGDKEERAKREADDQSPTSDERRLTIMKTVSRAAICSSARATSSFFMATMRITCA
jgi:hypothetical protein